MCVPLPRWNLDFSKRDKFISISCHPAPSQPFFLPLPLLKVHFHSLNFLPFSSSSIPTCCRQRKQVSLLGLVEEGPGRQQPAPLTFRKFSFFKTLSFFSLSHLLPPGRPLKRWAVVQKLTSMLLGVPVTPQLIQLVQSFNQTCLM